MSSRTTYIDTTAIVEEGAIIGEGVSIWNWSKIRKGASIGENTSIGQNVYVDTDVVIGKRCKIQNGVSVYKGVTLGDDVFVGPYAVFTNDHTPRAFGEWSIVNTIVDTGASIGANATILCGVKLGRYCMIGAGSVVTINVAPHTLVVGVPARPVDYVTIRGRRLNWDVNKGLPAIDLLSD